MTVPWATSALAPAFDTGADVAAPTILALPKGCILAECG